MIIYYNICKYLKAAKRIDPKSSHHKGGKKSKRGFCFLFLTT